MATSNDNIKLDESLYSRQLYAIGKNTMTSIINAKVLIINSDPLAIEIMKNIILCGVGTITISNYNNNNTISDKDFNNYYISDKDFGKDKSDIIGSRLKDLNPNVKINKYNGPITNKLLSKFNLVIFIDQLLNNDIFNWNEYCRQHNIKTILASSRGFMGYIFCDFGEFITTDQTGEKNRSGYLVSHNNKTCITAKYHDFEVGSQFKLTRQDKLTQQDKSTNNMCFQVTKILSLTSFEINQEIDQDLTQGCEYEEVKQSKTIQFKSLRESIKDPEFVFIDYKDFDMPSKLHNINCKILQNQKDQLDMTDKLTSKIYNAYDGQLVPVNSIIGGLVANMVISGVANKYTPIKQWLYYECTDICEPKNINYNYQPRYSSQVKVIGTELQQAIDNYKLFIVGSGAIGCEHLKNFSMMGVKSQIITDMDTIEKSNLNRQFLFRNNDIGKHKAEIAAKRVCIMNPHINIQYKLNKVDVNSENIFNKSFYDNVDCIVNALDNIQARIYMDNQAINYKKPLLESGTLGLKGNVQVILPDITETYQSSSDNSNDSIPMCTLKNFPYEISHCIQWAREQFESLFVIPYKVFNDLKELTQDNTSKLNNNNSKLNNKLNSKLINKLNNLSLDELRDIKNHLDYIIDNNKYQHFFDNNFYINISELIKKYPKDYITDEGEKFWSGTKRYPTVINFDNNNNICYDNYTSYMHINNNNNLDIPDLDKLLTSLELSYVQRNNINLDNKDNLVSYCYDIINTIDKKFNIIEFEKDNDSNGHIKFITSTANLRALNYNIPTVSEFEAKGIAGKIIPALATTTSIVSGLVAIELYKIISNKLNLKLVKSPDNFKNTFLSLGMFFMGSSEPGPCKITKLGKLNLSVWSVFKFKSTNTIQDICDYFEEQYIEVDEILHNNKKIYSSYGNNNKLTNKDQLTKVIDSNSSNIMLQASVTDINNEEKSEIINIIID